MISGFRVRNLRAIRDSGLVRLSRITVMVGKNSAGKSTLLRVLPLLRQSVERPTKGPILWFGRLVDFGAYQNVVNSFDKAGGVHFEFQMNLQGAGRSFAMESDRDVVFWGGSESARFYRGLPKVTATLTLGKGANDQVGNARCVRVDLGKDVVEIDFSGDPVISINNVEVSLPPKKSWLVQSGKILPVPVLVKEESFEEGGITRNYLTHDVRPFSEELIEALSPLFHGNTSREKIAEFAGSLLYSGPSAFYEQLKAHSHVSHSYSYNLSLYDARSEFIARIRWAVLLSSLSGLFRRIDRELVDFASGVKYVEPIRATAERYYRLQDLAVDEIDSRGENVAMFLNSLSSYEASRLKRWMLEHLGFSAEVEQGSGHVQVKISEEGGHSKNIADLGFGYSQLLPIILQIWRSLVDSPYSRFRSEAHPVVAIEQPELHLHPQFQSQIADVLAAAIGTRKQGSSSVVIETHSEHIINRLGQLVAYGKLKKDDVQVLVVESGPDGCSTVRRVTFDDKGFMDAAWPAGFFVPEATL